MIRLPLLLPLCALYGCAPKEPALEAAAAAPASRLGAPTDPLPVDPKVASGVLPNGLTWFVEENGEPAQRAELRLVVRVGSVVEDEDQLGLAHFLEHMAFNGSENFQGNALIDYMESVGMKFGAHLNASTGFDLTTYKLTVPTDDPALLDKGLQVLRDQGGRLLLEAEAIEGERGVVLEEWRGRRGAGGRITDKVVASTFAGSKYAERLPIGTEESLKTFDHEALRRFYADWYRPDLMAVMAVGDFDQDTVVALIEAHFGDMTGPADPRPREEVAIPPRDEAQVLVVSDPEIPRSSVNLIDQLDEDEGSTFGDYRASMARGVLFGVVNERFSTLAQDPEAPFLGAGAGYSRMNRTEVSWSAGGSLKEGSELDGIEAILVEIERVRRFGITQAELDRARTATLAWWEGTWAERDKTRSSSNVAELIRVWSTGESMPGLALEYEMAKAWMPQLTVAEVNAVAADWMKKGSLVVQVVGPEKEGLVLPEADQIKALLASVPQRELEAPAEETIDGPILDPLPEGAGTIVSTRTVEELGLTIWTLSNGIEVWLKPTDFKQDEVLLAARSHGGRALVPDEDYVAIASSEGIRGRSGLGAFDAPSLQKRLKGVRAGVGADISRYGESLSGSGSPEALEEMLQLAVLQLTQPRFTEQGLALYRRSKEESIRNRDLDPGTAMSDAWDRLVWGDSPRMQPWTLQTLDQLDLARSEALYKARFQNPGDFTYMFTGALDLAVLEPLVLRYLGTLPTTETREERGDDGARMLKGDRRQVVRAGLEPKARVRMMWHGPTDFSWLGRNRFQAMEDILEVRLRKVLREDLGGVYGVSVGGGQSDHPVVESTLTISFGCDPERADELSKAARAEVARFLAEPPTAEEIATEQAKNRRAREESIRSNGFWSGAILGTVMRGEELKDLLGWDERNDTLSSAEVHAAAKRVFEEHEGTVEVVLLPLEQPPVKE